MVRQWTCPCNSFRFVQFCLTTLYSGNCISYVLLLTLYSYVAVFGYRWGYQIPELVLYGWAATLG